jgi:hypothetical protein
MFSSEPDRFISPWSGGEGSARALEFTRTAFPRNKTRMNNLPVPTNLFISSA